MSIDEAIKVLMACLTSPDERVRLRAAVYVMEKINDV